MKKLICLIIVVTFLMPCAVYSASDSTNTTIVNLTLEDVLAKLEQNNGELDLIRQKISIYERRYKTSLEKAEKAVGKSGYNDQLNIMYQKEGKLDWQLKLLELEDIQNEYKNLLFNKKINIKQLYYNLLSMQSDFEIINNEIVDIDKKIEDLNIKIKLGKALDNDKKLLQVQKLALVGQKNELSKQIDNSMISIKKEIGIDVFKKLILTNTTVNYSTFDIANVYEKIDAAVQSDFDLVKLNKKLQLKVLEKKITVDNTTIKDSLDLTTFDMAISELELQIIEKKNNVSGDLWIEYNNLLNMHDNVLLEELKLEIEKINYATTSAKAKLGIVDFAMESDTRIAYNRQQTSLQRAKYNYLIAAEQLKYKLGM